MTARRRKAILWALAWLLLPAPGRAGAPPRALSQYVHQQWHAADGLPQETVQALVQSSDGYLWVGTQDGLARYDGSRFTLFHRDTQGLGNRDIQALAAGPGGEVWLGTGHGLYRYHRGAITPVGTDPRLSDAIVRSLLYASDGSVIAGTTNGLFRVRGNAVGAVLADGERAPEITRLAEGPGGLVIALSTHQLWRVRGSRLERFAEPPAKGPWRGLRFDGTGALLLTGAPGLWKRDGDRFTRVPVPGAPVGQGVETIFEDADRRWWIGGDGGIVRMDPRDPVTAEAMGAEVGQVTAIVADHDGGLWVGTWGNGLHRFRAGRATILGKPEGLPGDYALGVFEARDGALWLGSDGGVTRLKDGKLKSWTTREGLVGRLGRAFFEDARGTIWIGTERSLCRIRGERLECGVTGIDPANIFAFEADGAGGAWIATTSGLRRMDADGVVHAGPTIEAGDASGVAWSLLRDRSGHLWVGGERTSLVRVTGDRIERFEPPVVPANFVLTAYEDEDGTAWFGTAGGGLIRHRDGRFSTVTTANGLPDDVLYAIVPDGLGHFWISSNRGIFRVARAGLAAVADGRAESVAVDVVGVADGLRSAECNGTVTRAGLRTRDGRLWFPTTRGFAFLDPQEAVRTRPVPVVIEDVLADRRSVSPLSDTLVLPPGGGEVEFHFGVLAFSAGATGLVRYRLEGHDDVWRVAGGERTARYTNLRPAHYTFRVATGDAGTAEHREAVLPVELQAHFYQRPWVQALGVLGVLVLAGAVVVIRERQLRMRQIELQRGIDEALSQVKVLQGMLPVCAWCRKVRSDEGYWQQLETYVSARSNAAFTHGICPSCAAKLEGESGQG